MRIRQKRTNQVPVVQVITDSSDSSRDYLLPRERAEELYLAGRLSRMYCYATGVQYYDATGRYRREQIRML